MNARLPIAMGLIVALQMLGGAYGAPGQAFVDIYDTATGAMRQATLPLSLMDSRPTFHLMPPSPQVLNDPAALAAYRKVLANRPPELDRPPQARSAAAGATVSKNAALIGTYRAIVLLVDFEDHRPRWLHGTQGVSHYQDMLFSVGTYPTGSMRDWYKENSYNKFDITGDVQGGARGWYRAPKRYAYYTDQQYGLGSYPRNSQRLVEDVVKLADPDVDFSRYDNDGNGIIESLFVVHTGPGAEATGRPEDIWSHMWGFAWHPGGAPLQLDGVSVSDYSIEPENGRIGVFCHEYGHILGAWDLYDYGNDWYGYDSAGLGVWSVMSGGSWGANYRDDRRPAHFDMWHKILFGWVEPVVWGASKRLVDIPRSEDNPVAYILWKDGKPGPEYFLVENRQKFGFDSELYGSGLLIYHIDERKFGRTVNDDEWFPGRETARHYAVAIEQADGRWDLEHNYNVGDAGDTWPGSANQRTFGAASTPDSRSYRDGASGVSISNISDSAETMQALFQISAPRAATWYVDARANGYGNGGSPDTPFSTLREALAVAASGDRIVVAPGVYTESINYSGRNLEIVSSDPENPQVVRDTIIRAPRSGPTVTLRNGEGRRAELNGFTITHLPGAVGSGLNLKGASPTLSNLIIRDNNDARPSENYSHGGGLLVTDGGYPLLTNVQFLRNTADRGAGLCLLNSSARIDRCLFDANRASVDGGALYCSGDRNSEISDSVFSNNEAKRAGAIYLMGSTPLIRGCLVSGNSARNFGGGLVTRNAGPTIVNSTIVNCRAFLYETSLGGGLFCTGERGPVLANVNIVGCSAPVGAGVWAASGCTVTMTSSILAFNTGGATFQVQSPPELSYTNVFSPGWRRFAAIPDLTGTNGIISADPRFADRANGDFHLKSRAGRWTPGGVWVKDDVSSPCLDTGDPAADCSYEPKPNGGRLNMGAYGNTPQASLSFAGRLIAASWPQDGAADVVRRPVIKVTYNSPVVEASAEEHFSLMATPLALSGRKSLIAGSFRWVTPGKALHFVPTDPLPAGSRFTLSVGGGLTLQDGSTADWTEQFSFTTGVQPAVTDWSPRRTGVPVSSPLSLQFDREMDRAAVEAALSITPLAPGRFEWPTATRLNYLPSFALDGGTEYHVVLGPAARAADGVELGQEFGWRFTTSPAVAAGPVLAATASATPSGGAQITLNLASASTVEVAITNLAGLTIATLASRDCPAGVTTLLWSGQSRTGTRVPRGQYLVRVQARQSGGVTSSCLTSLRF